jgi:1,4-dihydroxy-2-naphthoate octaprenyltransferase
VLAPLRAFLRLSRLKFLAGGVLGAGLGTAVAAHARAGRFDWQTWLVVQLTVTAFQWMTHYANDFFDREGDRSAVRTPFSGGSGALVDGSLPPLAGLGAAFLCVVLGMACCGILAARGQTAAAGLGIAIGVLAWFYSAPPLRLLARGLGELDTALVVAMLVPLCAFAAQTGAWASPVAVASSLPGAAAMLAMMLCVEAPDVAADAASGKRNLVVRFGRPGLVRLGRGAIAFAYIGVALAVLAGAPYWLAVLELMSLPPGVALWFALGRDARTPDPLADANLAAQGVAFFFLVSFDAVLGFAVALPWHI